MRSAVDVPPPQDEPLRISAKPLARYLGSAHAGLRGAFVTWTADGLLRQGAYEGQRMCGGRVRSDKAPFRPHVPPPDHRLEDATAQ
jgi:hypothetical protein